MSRCRQCNIEINDETHVCPLCKCVLETTEGGENKYPDVRMKTKKLMLIVNIYLFCAILVSAIAFGVNYGLPHTMWWSAIVVAALAYIYLVLRYAISGQSGYKSKLIVLTVAALAFIMLVDHVTGYRGWSNDYVIPGAIMFIDLAIIMLMIVNKRNWQSYLLFELFMVLCGSIPLILIWVGIIVHPIPSIVAMGCSVFLFLGTLIIGDRRARIELKRRFHVR